MTAEAQNSVGPATQPMASNNRRDLLERSLVTIRELRARVESLEQRSWEPIAIVGLACRFPGGCSTPEAFWDLLRAGGSGISAAPVQRTNTAEPNAWDGVQGGFLREDIAGFDAHFFSISPREAEEMDPQHRLLLETTWEALERAGIDPHTIRGTRSGVFVGISGSEYGMLPRPAGALSPYTATGLTANLASGRLAYFYGTTGPAVSIDTACSSSLVAAHLACRSLQAGDCELALVAGVNALLAPQPFQALRQLGALAADGHCKTFSAEADGYGRGEGCGVVVLKRLARAQTDGDRIWAVIRGSAVNQDGASSGLTVPNGLAQQALQREALAAAGVDAASIDFIETHGTGTPIGDPIEVQAIRTVHGTRKGRPVYLGAVKSAIGHLEAAAGIASLIKVVLALQQRTIPPQPLVGALNPRINLSAIPAILSKESQPWNVTGHERLAGISSFGFSGTNAHLIVAEAPVGAPTSRRLTDLSVAPLLLKITGDSDDALSELARRYAAWLRDRHELDLGAFCWAANTHRASLAKRAVVLVRDHAQTVAALDALASGATHGDLIHAGESCAKGDDATDIRALAGCFVSGAAIAWTEITPRPGTAEPIALPTYPFQHRRYWLPSVEVAAALPVQPRYVDSPGHEQAVEFGLSRVNLPDAADNNGVLHVGHYQALAAASVRTIEVHSGTRAAESAPGWCFEAAEFLFALRLPEDGEVRVQVVLENTESRRWRYRVFSSARPVRAEGTPPTAGSRWVLHAQGYIGRADSVRQLDLSIPPAINTWTHDAFYDRLREQGFALGPSVSLLREVTFSDGYAEARIPSPTAPSWTSLPVAPAVFDVCGQLLFAAAGRRIGARTTFMVARWERLTLNATAPSGDLRVRMALRPDQPSGERLVADYQIATGNGAVVAVAEGVEFQLLTEERIRALQQAAIGATATAPAIATKPRLSETEARAALIRIVSAAVRVPASELDPAESLRRLGVDSIVGVEIRGRMERETGVVLPLEQLIAGASIDELVRAAGVAGPDRPVRASKRNPWLVCEQRRPDARIRLFCVPSGSLGASQFAGWAERLPDSIEVQTWQLPGREERFGEKPFEDLDALVGAMENAVADELDRPYAIYGHSLGALIAHRLAYRLWQRAAIKPAHLFPGAFTSPVLPNPIVAKYRRRFQAAGLADIPGPRDAIGHAVAAQFVREGLAGTTALDTEQLAGVMLPTMLADMTLVRQYRHDPTEPVFDVPITAFHGDRDVDVTLAEIERWRELTTGKFDCRVLPGDHFFMHKDQARDALVTALGSILLSTTSDVDSVGTHPTSHPHRS